METLRERLTRKDIWLRALYMLVLAIAYSIAETIIVFLVFFQFLSILFGGHANAALLRFGQNLSTYVYQILRFQTFNTETRPFPFSSWPDENISDNPWRESFPVGGPLVSSDDEEEADARPAEERPVETDAQSEAEADKRSDEKTDAKTDEKGDEKGNEGRDHAP